MKDFKAISQVLLFFILPIFCLSQRNPFVGKSFFTPSATYVTELKINSDSAFINIRTTNLDTLKSHTKYKLIQVKRIKNITLLIVSDDNENQYEVISLAKVQNDGFKIAYTDVYGWRYSSFPTTKGLKKQFSNTDNLPLVKAYSKEEIEKFAGLKSLKDASPQEVDTFLDSLIYLKSAFFSIPECKNTYQKATIYMFHDFVGTSLLKNNFSPFYTFDFFQYLNEIGTKSPQSKEKIETYYSIK